MIQDKAQPAGNDKPFQGLYAVLDHRVSSLWASREAVVRGVAPLGKAPAIPCKTRLAANRFPTR